MQIVEMNVLQFALMVVFIYVFTYYWLPKIDIIKTPEYKKLFTNYNQVKEEREYWANLYDALRVRCQKGLIDEQGNETGPIVIGGQTSAHNSAIIPRSIDSTDNYAVQHMLF
jgi:hypothetical protein